MSNFPIILLAGYSCAGKTTIASGFSKRRGLDHISSQELLDELTKKKGYSRTRDWISEVGVERFMEESIPVMLVRIKGLKESKGVLIDGTSGDGMVNTIKNAFPKNKVVVVYVRADEGQREIRMKGRLGGVKRKAAKKELSFRDEFLKKVGLEQLLRKTDLELVNKGNINQTLSAFDSKLRKHGIGF